MTRPKTRFKPTSPEKSGVDGGANQVPTYLGQLLHMYSPWCTFFAKQFIHFEIWDKIYNTTHGMWCGVVERHLEMSQATKNIFTTLKYYVLLTNIKRRTSDYTYFYSGEEFQPKKKKKEFQPDRTFYT